LRGRPPDARVDRNGVVSGQTESTLELFLEREQAEALIAEVAQDEPETAADLRVEAVEL
jgi:hypothetical protein